MWKEGNATTPCLAFTMSWLRCVGTRCKVVETQEMWAKLSDAKCKKTWFSPTGYFFSAPLLATQ